MRPPNNNSLIALEDSKTMDVMVDYHHKLLNILTGLEVLKWKLTMFMKLEIRTVPSEKTESPSKLDMLLTLLLEMKSKWLMLWLNKDQLLSDIKSLEISKLTNQESTDQITVEQDQIKLIMLSWLLGMELKTELTTGLLRTHGEMNGVMRDTSKSKEELTCVPSPNVIHSQNTLETKTDLSDRKSVV